MLYKYLNDIRINVRKSLTKYMEYNIIITSEQMFKMMEVYIIWLMKIS